MDKRLSTEPYKGTRDFYPEDTAIQRYIFDTWAKTAESFGYERYDASILEPSELYKSKGAENEELVNEQTYTFIDRGDREVTLRPEMTPTVARMIAAKRRQLSFPVRWYSIPNLFRYERPQRGRLREHWQLNCDMFGVNHYSADVEMIALAYNVLTAFGADSNIFEIRINDRAWLNEEFDAQEIKEELRNPLLALLDRKEKIDNFDEEAAKILGRPYHVPTEIKAGGRLDQVRDSLASLGITNVRFSPSTVRGFNYYTGVVFEIFDVSGENSRSLIGGGRYDNLTSLFDAEPVSSIGFGMGDVTMRDFLETHNLLEGKVSRTAATLSIIPMEASHNIEAEKIAQAFRATNVRTSVDISDKKIGKKISSASETGVAYILVVGADEIASQAFTLKKLSDGSETTGSISELVSKIQ
jgi:histidyl-tRNA synthetase